MVWVKVIFPMAATFMANGRITLDMEKDIWHIIVE